MTETTTTIEIYLWEADRVFGKCIYNQVHCSGDNIGTQALLCRTGIPRSANNVGAIRDSDNLEIEIAAPATLFIRYVK